MQTKDYLRFMAWERAKGELNAMLQTYSSLEAKKFDILNSTIKEFIEDIENNGKHE